jgi:hypothetical protein
MVINAMKLSVKINYDCEDNGCYDEESVRVRNYKERKYERIIRLDYLKVNQRQCIHS